MKLVKGKGAPGVGACYMSAINYYVTNGETWSDQPECVSPVIRSLCIQLNDMCESDEERERLIGPHLFDPVGTAGDEALDRRRAFKAADMVCQVWAPRALRAAGFPEQAEKLEALKEVVDATTAKAAASAAYTTTPVAASAANSSTPAGIRGQWV